ncbi:PREDICTED: uncharacterized protein LOC109486537 [Branchiostoma belcheri]|uniref:Uncharacterized protein LOC109486537 n=1 Tax=Branchiostoma belcheri TaxID=7741 RepID=A0A6P5AS75_BRABE|nr:PREDICTED: uncharacterized protein LOC109486537 [Branchiostoma belcheri]
MGASQSTQDQTVRDVIQNSDLLEARLVLESIASRDQAEHTSETGEGASVANGTVSKEQLLKVQIPLPTEWTSLLQNKLTHVIVAADKSGSMAGNPWRQVQQALVYMIGDVASVNPSVALDVVIYNDKASVLQYAGSYQEAVNGVRADGMTSFAAAFGCIKDCLKTEIQGTPVSKTVVVFMTDGADTCNRGDDINRSVRSWKDALARLGHEVIVHVVGFSAQHDYNFLGRLRNTGTTAGLFRYTEPSDGTEALKAKLQELFDFVALSAGREVDMQMKLEGEDRFCTPEGTKQSVTITGEVVVEEQEEENTEGAAVGGSAEGVIQGGATQTEAPVTDATEALLSTCRQVASCNSTQPIQLDAPVFDPAAGVTAPEVKVKTSRKVDRAMEVWAKDKLGCPLNKKDDLTAAKKVVTRWLDFGPQSVGAQMEGEKEAKKDEYNPEVVTQSMLNIVAQLLHKLQTRLTPQLAALPSCIAFVNHWVSSQYCFSELDRNSGLAPDRWISEVKQAIKTMYSTVEEG